MSEPNISQFLQSVTAVNLIVAGRVYPDQLRQGTPTPAIVYFRVGGSRQKKSCGTDGLVLGNYQVDVYAPSRRAARDLARLVIGTGRRGATPPDAMLDYAGLMGTCIVKDCSLSTDFDTVDPDPGLYVRRTLWQIWYVEND